MKMGFPVGYTEFLLPKLLIHFLTLLCVIRKLILSLFRVLGLSDFLEPEYSIPTRPETHSVSASLIRELLPVVKISDIIDQPENCAVCLYEFEDCDDIRTLANCRHVFHKSCVDRWMDHDQVTCPLCRTSMVPDDFQEGFNERFWGASGIGDFYGDYSPISSSF